jgi:hypothetical protein
MGVFVRWVGVLLAAASMALGRTQIRVELADGRVLAGGRLETRGADRFLLSEPGSETLLWSAVLAVSFDAPPSRPAPGSVRVDLANGDRLFGVLEDGSFDDIALSTLGTGTIRVLLDALDTLHVLDAEGRAPELPQRGGGDDELFLHAQHRLDRILGDLQKVERTAVVFRPSGGEERRFPLAGGTVAALRLARGAAPRPHDPPFLVLFRDGSRLSGVLAEMAGGGLGLELPSGPLVPLHLPALLAIESRSSGERYLSELVPLRSESEPFLEGGSPLGILVDRARDGGPLRIGARSFRRGLALPIGTRVTYAAPAGASRLVGEVGLPPGSIGRGLAPAVVLDVFLDGRLSWSSAPGPLDETPRRVEVPLPAGVREVTLEARFAAPPPVARDLHLGAVLFR